MAYLGCLTGNSVVTSLLGRTSAPIPALKCLEDVSAIGVYASHVSGSRATRPRITGRTKCFSPPFGGNHGQIFSTGSSSGRSRLQQLSKLAAGASGRNNQGKLEELEAEEEEDEFEEFDEEDEDWEEDESTGIRGAFENLTASIESVDWTESIGDRFGIDGPLGKTPVVALGGVGIALAVGAVVSMLSKVGGEKDEKSNKVALAGQKMPDVPAGFGDVMITTVRNPEKDLRVFKVGFPMDREWPGVEEAAKRRNAERDEVAASSAPVEVGSLKSLELEDEMGVAAVGVASELPAGADVAESKGLDLGEKLRAENAPGGAAYSDFATEEILAAVVEERVAELESQYKDEMAAFKASAEIEAQVMQLKATQQAVLQVEVGDLRHQLRVVKELAEHLLDTGSEKKEEERSGQSENNEGERAEALAEQADGQLSVEKQKYEQRVQTLEERLRDESAQRRDLRAALSARKVQLEEMEGRLKAAESERDRLTKELRVALANCETVTSKCESLAVELDSANAAKDRAMIERDEIGVQLGQAETELRGTKRSLAQESAKLAQVEEAVGTKMMELGEKEMEVEGMQREVETMRKEAEKVRAELLRQEEKFAKKWKSFEKQQVDAMDEIAWLRSTAGEAALLAEELADIKDELRQYKTKGENGGAATAGEGAGTDAPGGTGGATGSGQVAVADAASGVGGVPPETLRFVQELTAVREQLEVESRRQEEKLAELSRKLAEAPKLAEEMEALRLQQVAIEGTRREEEEAIRVRAARLRWELAEAQVEQVRSDRRHLEEVEALKRQLAATRGGSMDERLKAAQDELENMRTRLAEQDKKMENFRKHAEFALANRERQLQAANETHAEELRALENRYLSELEMLKEVIATSKPKGFNDILVANSTLIPNGVVRAMSDAAKVAE